MAVIAILGLLLGSLLSYLASSHVIQATLAEEEVLPELPLLGVGLGIVIASSLLLALVQKRRGTAGIFGGGRASARLIGITAALLFVPLLAAWVQFELFWNPVHMMPVFSVLGALGLVYALSTYVFGEGAFQAAGRMSAVALIGLPLGLASVALPARHFNYHLTDVAVSFRENVWSRQLKTRIQEADTPDAVERPSDIGDNTLDFLSALANAEEINVQDEIDAGRMRRLDDGSLVRVEADGTTLPVVQDGFGEAMALLDEAQEADKKAADEEYTARLSARDQELAQRRVGGRLFGSLFTPSARED